MLTCGEAWKQDQTHRNFPIPIFLGNKSCDVSFAID